MGDSDGFGWAAGLEMNFLLYGSSSKLLCSMLSLLTELLSCLCNSGDKNNNMYVDICLL